MSTLKVNNIEPTSGASVTVNSELLIKGPGGDIIIGGTGSSNISASYAATAGCASNINISTIVPGDTTTSVVLVNNQAVGCQSPFIDSGLTYNAATNILNTTVTNATSATFATSSQTSDTVKTVNSPTTSSDFYLTFVDSNNPLAAPEIVYTSNNISYNNSQNSLSITGNITASGDLRFPNSGSAVVRPIINLIPTGTASFNPNLTNTTTYSHYGINVITTSTSQSYCVRLPQTPTQGKTVTLINKSGMNVVVFPSVIGGSINNTVNGYFILPSDGISYSFDCYENPLPGGWAVLNSGPGSTTTISTDVINYIHTTSSGYIGFVNDSCKISGSNLSSGNTYNGLSTPQYQTYDFTNNYGTFIGGQIFSDTIPTLNIWSSIDSIQILTNISYSSCQANLALSQGSNFEYYTPGNPNTYGSYLPLYTPQISSSFAAFITNVVTPWYNNHPGTAGTATNFGYNMFSSTTYLSSTTSEVPGVFTPSLQNPYASDNVGDPGTLILTVSNIPTVTWGPSLKMLGRNYVGQYVHPYDGPLDAYFNSAFLPILGLSVSDPLSNPVNVPNAKFQAFYNVSL
jgi:hypothetical protein